MRFQQTAVTDLFAVENEFKMKTAYFFIFDSRFRKFFLSLDVETV